MAAAEVESVTAICGRRTKLTRRVLEFFWVAEELDAVADVVVLGVDAELECATG